MNVAPDFGEWNPTRALDTRLRLVAHCKTSARGPPCLPCLNMGSLTNTSVLSSFFLSNGMVRDPLDLGSARWLKSANLASIPCSFQICFTDNNVYLNSGTQRTLVKANRTSDEVPFGWNALDSTGMSPIMVARVMCPLAWPKISSHGEVLMRRRQSSVQDAVQPESGVQ